MPENTGAPTPCPRFVYNGFDFVPELNSVFMTNGANSSAMRDGKIVGHAECENTWRFDLSQNKWTQIKSARHPANFPLGAALTYCSTAKKLIYCNYGELWTLEPGQGEWKKSKAALPERLYGQALCDDPLRKRMLVIGGTRNIASLDANEKGTHASSLFAFDPQTETIAKLADAPAPLYMAHMAHDAKRDIFITAPFKNSGEPSAGVLVYDPNADAWSQVVTRNPTPQSGKKSGGVALCFDTYRDCIIAFVPNSQAGADCFYAFRHIPAR
jgi:hypothetical protein